jgi:response regulator RpfG family c-di-GMP phosphodiesterase
MRQYRLVMAERELLEGTLQGAINVCTEILSSVDARAFGHAMRVSELAKAIAGNVGIDNAWQLEVASLLAPIGNATIPPVVMVRQRHGNQLSGVEKDMLSRVPEKGHNLLANIPRLGPVAKVVLYSQKHFDGSGFPGDAVAGAEIPRGARLLKILFDFVQLEANGETKLRAVEALRQRAGWYDPELLEASIEHLCPRPGGAIEVQNASLAVAFRDLLIGDLLTSNVETKEGVLIVQSGAFVTSTLLERRRNFVLLNPVKEPIKVVRRVAHATQPVCG